MTALSAFVVRKTQLVRGVLCTLVHDSEGNVMIFIKLKFGIFQCARERQMWKQIETVVYSCRHRKSSALVSSMYCVWRLLCTAVGTASHQHWLAACTVYGDRTVCSCRHSKSSAWVSSMYCVWRLYCVQL